MQDKTQLLEQITEAIVREIAPEQIYLFGSFATGKSSGDSDLDLLIVEMRSYSPGRSRRNSIRRVRRALRPFHIPKDIVVFSHEEFQKWKNSPNHIIAQCLKEGELLYERH